MWVCVEVKIVKIVSDDNDDDYHKDDDEKSFMRLKYSFAVL